MENYINLFIYIASITLSLIIFWFVDFNKFIRVDKKMYAIIVYILFSLSLGFLIGKLFIELGGIFLKFAN